MTTISSMQSESVVLSPTTTYCCVPHDIFPLYLFTKENTSRRRIMATDKREISLFVFILCFSIDIHCFQLQQPSQFGCELKSKEKCERKKKTGQKKKNEKWENNFHPHTPTDQNSRETGE